jgi:hypothetical protein
MEDLDIINLDPLPCDSLDVVCEDAIMPANPIDTRIRKRAGRRPSTIWELYTDDKNPHNSRTATCKHCKQTVLHYKKSESAQRHLNSCAEFSRYVRSIDPSKRPEWFTSKKANNAMSSSICSSNQKKITSYAIPPVSQKDKTKFQQLMALHYYLTGTSFARIEESSLAKAIEVLRPDQNLLPSRKLLAEKLLDNNYEQLKKVNESYLRDKLSYFCLTTDGWSNIRNDPIINYIATSPKKTLFLESVSTGEQSHNSNFIASDILRIMEKYNDTKFCGVVTDNTAANKNAWCQLKLQLPNHFFQGCMSHGLNLLVKDIFAATKTRKPPSNEMQYPDAYPFENLLEFADNCKDVVKFFYNHHLVKASLESMQKSADVNALVRPAVTRFVCSI